MPLSAIAISKQSVRIHRTAEAFALVAARRIHRGEGIIEPDGVIEPRATRWSIEIGPGAHLHPHPGVAGDVDDPRCPWRFMNHACQPNAVFNGVRFAAIRRIEVGDEITFDYETTEWEMAEPFRCACGTCDGRLVRGFRHLELAERELRRDRLAPHLVVRLDR